MAQSLGKIVVHTVFSTKERRPFLRDRKLREELHCYIGSIISQFECQPIIVGGVEDHMNNLNRTLEPDGAVSLTAGDCRFIYRRPKAHIIEVTISGVDRGQFGSSTLDELRLALMRERPLEIFIDAREAMAPAVSVSQDWTRFFCEHHNELKRVSVLVGSKVLELTVAIARHLSRTGQLIQIYSDPETFDQRRSAAIKG